MGWFTLVHTHTIKVENMLTLPLQSSNEGLRHMTGYFCYIMRSQACLQLRPCGLKDLWAVSVILKWGSVEIIPVEENSLNYLCLEKLS